MLQELTAEKQKIQIGKVPEMWLKKLNMQRIKSEYSRFRL